jgi:hypothetical protein
MTNGTRSGWGVSFTPRPLFTSGKTRYPLYRRLGVPQDRYGQMRKIWPPPGFDPRIVLPVASRYTDWATRPTSLSMKQNKIKLSSNWPLKIFENLWFNEIWTRELQQLVKTNVKFRSICNFHRDKTRRTFKWWASFLVSAPRSGLVFGCFACKWRHLNQIRRPEKGESRLLRNVGILSHYTVQDQHPEERYVPPQGRNI